MLLQAAFTTRQPELFEYVPTAQARHEDTPELLHEVSTMCASFMF